LPVSEKPVCIVFVGMAQQQQQHIKPCKSKTVYASFGRCPTVASTCCVASAVSPNECFKHSQQQQQLQEREQQAQC
jgi:fibrillarin-like rRNA methylase